MKPEIVKYTPPRTKEDVLADLVLALSKEVKDLRSDKYLTQNENILELERELEEK